MFSFIHFFIAQVIFYLVAFFVALMALRLFFNYRDPNPFSKVGRFAWQLKKKTDSFVKAPANFLALWRIDTRLAPLVTLLVACVLGWFVVQTLGNIAFVLDGLALGIAQGKAKVIIGFVLFAALSFLSTMIFIRFVATWFVSHTNPLLSFARQVTDPILIPFRKLIPTVGMFDISAMIAMILLGFMQTIVLKYFVY